MSLAVNLLFRLTEQVAGLLDDDYDIEIVEMHHRHKIDAPSGTALGLGRAAARARGVSFDEVAARGRDGVTGARPARRDRLRRAARRRCHRRAQCDLCRRRRTAGAGGSLVQPPKPTPAGPFRRRAGQKGGSPASIRWRTSSASPDRGPHSAQPHQTCLASITPRRIARVRVKSVSR